MGCAGCGTKTANGLPAGCKNNGSCATSGCGDKLDVYDWLQNIYYHEEVVRHPLVEVKFKGTRKEYFRNVNGIELEIGDAVVVESQTSGWDMGFISLTGELVKLQMKKYRLQEDSEQIKRLLRKAGETDFEKYEEGKNLEYETMLQARRLANSLNLTMKISDVEYQGDRTKATFFYTAEGRVDFRELIKVLAREFKIKIEMRQIGLRQEAGRLGGIGSCGRELCCSTWLTDFHSVPTTAARYQNLFLNPLKLSGQCGRLKCCLNYELDLYVEALAEFPDENTVLRTVNGLARVEKLDILKRVMWFRYQGAQDGRFVPLEIEDVKRIIELNENGELPNDLDEFQLQEELVEEVLEFKDTVGEESLDRFDRRKDRGNRNRNKSRNRPSPEIRQNPATQTPSDPVREQRQSQNRNQNNSRRENREGEQNQQQRQQNNPNRQRPQSKQDGTEGNRPSNESRQNGGGNKERGNNRNRNNRPGGNRPNRGPQNNEGSNPNAPQAE